MTFPEGTEDVTDKMVSLYLFPSRAQNLASDSRRVLTSPPFVFFLLQVMPGDNLEMNCELTHDTPIEVGSRFSLREGGKTVGTGLVTELVTIS